MRIRPAAAVLAAALVVLAGAGWVIARTDHDAREPVAAGSLAAVRRPSAGRPVEPARGVELVTARAAGVERFAPVPRPVRVTIPALGVDAPVVPVGVHPDRTLEVPDRPSTAGWYRHGPAPGAPAGSSVLASHVDSAAEGAGAFFRLAQLTPGITVGVVRSDGSTLQYEVVALAQFPKDELERHDLFSLDGPHRLTLLTCGGEFDPESRTYRDNVVAVAIPAGARPAS